MISELISGVFKPVTSIVDKLVLDKDKYAEIQLKKLELKSEAQALILSTTTTPTVDAWVKVLVTLKDVVIPLFRPVGSFAMAVFAGYCVTEGIELPEYVLAGLFGSPIAWGASRHSHKKAEIKKNDWDED